MTIGPFKAIPEDYLVSPKGQLILQGQVSLFDLILTIDQASDSVKSVVNLQVIKLQMTRRNDNPKMMVVLPNQTLISAAQPSVFP